MSLNAAPEPRWTEYASGRLQPLIGPTCAAQSLHASCPTTSRRVSPGGQLPAAPSCQDCDAQARSIRPLPQVDRTSPCSGAHFPGITLRAYCFWRKPAEGRRDSTALLTFRPSKVTASWPHKRLSFGPSCVDDFWIQSDVPLLTDDRTSVRRRLSALFSREAALSPEAAPGDLNRARRRHHKRQSLR